MGASPWVFLTGATGFLGRFLLRELLTSGYRVALLARDTPSANGAERVSHAMAFWNDPLLQGPDNPIVFSGDLHSRNLGLSLVDRSWLARYCRRVVHAAASVSFGPTSRGEPWATNVEGTARLIDLCASLGVTEFHHVSTAFVCGNRTGLIDEADLDCGQDFHNDYERSKFEAESLVQTAKVIHATVYRPGIIVGDSRTGATSSYQGIYRFLEAAVRLARPVSGSDRRFLPMRLPFRGDEPRNLVPVDWVAQAVVRIMNRSACHGSTYHLTSPTPVCVGLIKEVAEEMMGIEGVCFSGPGPLTTQTILEEAFLAKLREYWPYLRGEPTFASLNTQMALPDLPAPTVGRTLLARLLQFAIKDRWGRISRRRPSGPAAHQWIHYVERFFPCALRSSALAKVPLDVTVSLHVLRAGRWLLRWRQGELVEIRPDAASSAEVVYRLDATQLEALVKGHISPEDAFLSGHINVEGDIEKGLKLGVLLGQFIKEYPYEGSSNREEFDDASVPA